MGDRCVDIENVAASGTRRIAVFDLDGTVYRGSTFRKFLFFGAAALFRRAMFLKSFRVMWRFALSKAGMLSHRVMKHSNCLLLESIFQESDYRDFTDTLMRDVNGDVVGFMTRLKEDGYITVLSTASPESYCRVLADRLGFDLCHATSKAPECEREYVENRGERKLDKIRELESKSNGKLAVVVTDHHDDIPLLKANSRGENYLVNPSDETLAGVRSEGVAVRQ